MKKKKQKIKGRFVPVPYAMIDSIAWKELSGNNVKILLEIDKRNWEAKNNGSEFIIPYSYYQSKISISKPVFYKSLKELCKWGFLEKTQPGGLLRNAAKFKFSDDWTNTNKDIVRQRTRTNAYKPQGGVIDEK